MVKTYKKGVKVQLSPHFASTEFDCPCNNCKETLIDDHLVSRLELARNDLATSVHVNSAYRCSDYQLVLKHRGYEAAKNSQHVLGKAADIQTGVHTGPELEEAARKAGFTSVGVGKNWVHVDTREGHHAWKYS